MQFASIHVGGTSGKGSTATMTAAILTAAGYRTGLHLSPHLQILNERFQINGRMVSTSLLERTYSALRPLISDVADANPWGAPSYFEVQVAMAFTLFAEEGVDVAVVEVGLGGRLDATNVVPARVAILTNVGLDHTEILGNTVDEIATDKVEIVKPGAMVISGLRQISTQKILESKCSDVGATVLQLGTDFDYRLLDVGEGIRLTGEGFDCAPVVLGLGGAFQFANAACATAAATAMQHSITCEAISGGLSSARIPGRFEIVQSHPTVVLDGAHNADKMRSAVVSLVNRFPHRRIIAVLSLKSDKSLDDILPPLLTISAGLVCTEFRLSDLWEARSARDIANAAQLLQPDLDIKVVRDPIDAVRTAMGEASGEDVVVVTGSLYLVGNVRDLWYPRAQILQALEEEDE
jgi:dihydrofolate synthase/folylpolyglutamate synthase